MLHLTLPTLGNLFGRDQRSVKIGTFNGNQSVLLFGGECTKVFPSIEVCGVVYRAEGTAAPRVDNAVRSKENCSNKSTQHYHKIS